MPKRGEPEQESVDPRVRQVRFVAAAAQQQQPQLQSYCALVKRSDVKLQFQVCPDTQQEPEITLALEGFNLLPESPGELLIGRADTVEPSAGFLIQQMTVRGRRNPLPFQVSLSSNVHHQIKTYILRGSPSPENAFTLAQARENSANLQTISFSVPVQHQRPEHALAGWIADRPEQHARLRSGVVLSADGRLVRLSVRHPIAWFAGERWRNYLIEFCNEPFTGDYQMEMEAPLFEQLLTDFIEANRQRTPIATEGFRFTLRRNEKNVPWNWRYYCAPCSDLNAEFAATHTVEWSLELIWLLFPAPGAVPPDALPLFPTTEDMFRQNGAELKKILAFLDDSQK